MKFLRCSINIMIALELPQVPETSLNFFLLLIKIARSVNSFDGLTLSVASWGPLNTLDTINNFEPNIEPIETVTARHASTPPTTRVAKRAKFRPKIKLFWIFFENVDLGREKIQTGRRTARSCARWRNVASEETERPVCIGSLSAGPRPLPPPFVSL